ncbi:hypothetical protein [Dethiobacter alkaliphilus]|uniref:Uncharacterized protein n=1 Tax=Dethiobacter alkaliphilus AHT 1 TaxID=555088 RepID=C0GI30_DETAL|nr:hypothetical protein [Dethiobacter alkaliphilus]EEG77104.1 hypothetical protein DealDRAFT_2139 [Dethiobacter alkaliphilus AHT 1]
MTNTKRFLHALSVTFVVVVISMYARAIDWGIVPTLLAVGSFTAITSLASLEFKMKNIILQFLIFLSAILILDLYANVRGFESFIELGVWSLVAVVLVVSFAIRALVKQ